MTTVTTQGNTEAVTTEATVAVATPKAPSKKSLALGIFQSKMAERSQGLFGSNKEFRAAVLSSIQAELGVSTASAATMYNAAKKDAEAADAGVKLGRDPKKEKPVSTGKRGRPQGSKNKDKVEAAPVADAVVAAEVAPAVAEVAAEVAPAV
jgi:hypothetical protein